MQRPPSVRAVTIPFADLEDTGKDLSGGIGDGFGRQGLGIISITDVPGYPELRKRLLRLAPRVANLPEEVKKGLEDPNSRYNFGWSHGKQKFESGKFDTFKGSYFANPLFDVPTTDGVLLTRFPSYCRPNIWPTDDLPELETGDPRDTSGFCELFSTYLNDKAELPFSPQNTEFHGLTCGLFMRKSVEIPCPDSGAGLHIRSRDNRVVKVTFKDDELAYMTGETAEILSRGHLRATPHCVKAPSREDASLVDRSTFALFVQPNWDEKIKFPSEFPYHQELSIPPNETLAYGEYSDRILNKHYEART